jgi:glucosylceramidase
MTMSSRRRFLQSLSAATALASTRPSLTWAAETGNDSPSVKVWSTYRDRRHAADRSLTWQPMTDLRADAIVLDPATRKQEILGFGGAFTDATCYLLSQMMPSGREALMHELFAPEEMALNVCRTTIGASDYSRNAYSYDESETPDPELKKFSIEHDRAYILPILHEARRINPKIFLFSSPWSPPGWMKSANTLLGGSMRDTYFAPYADYLRRFLVEYKAAGIEIDAITVQNEVDSEQDGKMPQCIWGQQYEIQFVNQFLGPTLLKAGIATKIWVLDHNYDLWGRAIAELSDAAANKYIDGIAWHGYMGNPSSMSLVHNQFPGKNAYWTEGGPFVTQADYATEWARWGELFNLILNNWCRSITAWNLVLDQHGNPNIGPFACGETVTVENGSQRVVRSGQYWALAHLSRHIARGARVVATNGLDAAPPGGNVLDVVASTALTHAGFLNPDGSMVVVLANRGGQRQIQLVLGNRHLRVSVPADSLLTLAWS